MPRKKYENFEGIKNLIAVADLHCGCQFGLYPDYPIQLDGAGNYIGSKLQKVVYGYWREFWDEWVPMVTRDEDFAVVIVGDATDGEHHGNKTHISTNLNDQANIAIELLKPVIERCKGRFYMIRGTEAHVGKSAELEENLAKHLGAVPNEVGQHARWDMWVNMGGMYVHLLHHIGTTSSMAYESTALFKEYNEFCADSARWQRPAPSVILRAHRHRLIETRVPTKSGYGIAVVLPGWQLKTPFTWRIAGGRVVTPQFGGVLVRLGDEELYVRHKVWTVERSKEVVL